MSQRRVPPPSGWVAVARRCAWKNRVQEILLRDLGLSDVWDADDSYDLHDVWLEAYAMRQTPTEFVQNIFADDYARCEGDAREHEEADEYAAEPGDDEEPE